MRSMGWFAVGLALAGCGGGGHLHAVVEMPPPGRLSESNWTPGVVVDAADGSAVCERLRVYITPLASAPSSVSRVPAGTVKYTGRGMGSYDPSERRCVAAAVDLEPGDDYWLVVDYPPSSPDDPSVGWYVTAKPTLAPPTISAGAWPVRIGAKETTELRLSLTAAGGAVGMPPK